MFTHVYACLRMLRMLRTNTFAGIDFASLICKISKIISARITQLRRFIAITQVYADYADYADYAGYAGL